jgi:hypothetical protein
MRSHRPALQRSPKRPAYATQSGELAGSRPGKSSGAVGTRPRREAAALMYVEKAAHQSSPSRQPQPPADDQAATAQAASAPKASPADIVGLMPEARRDERAVELASNLLVAEYQSVREEWLAARSAQHQTWQWSMAALAVLVAATVTAGSRAQHSWSFVLGATATVVFATASQVIWLGEFLRMERAALFLRGREAALHRTLPTVAGQVALRWEIWRANRPVGNASPWVPGAGLLVAAAMALYAIAAIAGIVVLVVAARDHLQSHSARVFAWITFGACAFGYVAVAGYTIRLGVGHWQVRREPADLS